MDEFHLLIVGGGPGGIAPLLAAHRMGQLEDLLKKGVCVVEKTTVLGAGSIGGYAINSDSSGRTFTDCLQSEKPTDITRLAHHPLTQRLSAAGDGTVTLHDAGRFLGLVGETLATMIAREPASAVMTSHTALKAARIDQGWNVEVRDEATGVRRVLRTRHLVLATGADQPIGRLSGETIGHRSLTELCGDRLIQSGDVLTTGGLARVADLLGGRAAPKVAIVGGSTSAAAVAHALLHRLPTVTFGNAGITLLHRRDLRIFYPDRESALHDHYDEWTEEDVCPVSGRVFRLAGFRLDSRELIMQARGIGGRPPEARLHLHRLTSDDTQAHRIINEADVVVAALGYRPRVLPLVACDGTPIDLLVSTGPQQPLVDRQCRVLDADGRPIASLFGIGLAAGFVPSGALGGERSFRGQANGLWLWQHDVGSLIVKAVLRTAKVRGGINISRASTKIHESDAIGLSAISAL
ncbi:FAD-dependent oxidoreductase [Acidisoma cladoniae]|jgi:hypothetical protein|uniref:FAD-dependent oxidoreductase n=1 Tax=Acidisoma cladoniae TaxID=3040935 RepID=UPI00254BFEC8|nr:FAD-dependent oxidoreductase [Acidisoma sp. PAMC 29798]